MKIHEKKNKEKKKKKSKKKIIYRNYHIISYKSGIYYIITLENNL